MRPIGFYTTYDSLSETPTALHLLQEKFGDYCERLSGSEQLALWAIISHCMAANDQFVSSDEAYTLEDAWAEMGYDLSPELGALLKPLNDLEDGDLLGLCMTLIDNYDRVGVAA